MILFHPAVDLVLGLLLTLPVAVSMKRLLASRPGPALYSRTALDALVRGLLMVVLALGLLVVLKRTGIQYLFLGLETETLAGWGQAARLPGLLLAATVEEGAKLAILALPWGLSPFRRQADAAPEHPAETAADRPAGPGPAVLAWFLAAQGAGAVFGMAESLLYASNSLPLFMSRTPGALILHLCTTGILARSQVAGRPGRGLAFTVTIHLLYNLSLVLGGLWSLGALVVLGLGLHNLLSLKTAAKAA